MGVYCYALLSIIINTYRRGAFALLVLTYRAMRELRGVGRVAGTGPHVFFLFLLSGDRDPP